MKLLVLISMLATTALAHNSDYDHRHQVNKSGLTNILTGGFSIYTAGEDDLLKFVGAGLIITGVLDLAHARSHAAEITQTKAKLTLQSRLAKRHPKLLRARDLGYISAALELPKSWTPERRIQWTGKQLLKLEKDLKAKSKTAKASFLGPYRTKNNERILNNLVIVLTHESIQSEK